MVVTGGAGTAKTTECLRKAQTNPALRYNWVTFAKEPALETASRAAALGLTNFTSSTVHSMARRLLYVDRNIKHGEPVTLREVELYKNDLSAEVASILYSRRNEIGAQFPTIRPGEDAPYEPREWHDVALGPNCNNIADDLVEIVYERYDLRAVLGNTEDELCECGQGLIVDILHFIQSRVFDDVVSGRHYSFDWSIQCSIQMGLHETLCRTKSPDTGYDCLMFDEAQDLSVDLFNMMPTSAHIQKIFLGESAQSIYNFRVDCFNVFEHEAVENFLHLHFRQSYRCSPETVAYAKKVCEDTDLQIDMIGNPDIKTRIYDGPNQYELDAGLSYGFLGREWIHCFGFLIKVDRLGMMRSGFTFRFFGYDSPTDALACLDEKVPEPTDLKLLIKKWIEDDGRYGAAGHCDLGLGSVHTAKGLSIPNVILSDVVIRNVATGGTSTDSDNPSLAYVAITRAVERLILVSSVRDGRV